jgi:hypothetical protein
VGARELQELSRGGDDMRHTHKIGLGALDQDGAELQAKSLWDNDFDAIT